MSKDIEALIERLEKATGADRELDGAIEVQARRFQAYAVGLTDKTRAKWKHNGCTVYDGNTGYEAEKFTASIDAALALCERCGFPLGQGKWNYTMAAAYGSFSIIPNDPHSTGIHDKRCGHAHSAPTIPVAILLALFRALQARSLNHEESRSEESKNG